MKRITTILFLTALLLSVLSIAQAESWNCPTCGQTGNTGNYCSNCGTSRPDSEWTCWNCGQTGNTGNYCSNCGVSRWDGSFDDYSSDTGAVYNCPLLMRLSTRTGPSTGYDEPGSFFNQTWQTKQVNVYSKATGSGVWWLQVEFSDGGRKYRVYTGLKRVDVDINSIPEETCLGTGYVNAAGPTTGYYGPGRDYEPIKREIPWTAQVSIWAYENDYLLIDFYDSGIEMQRRAWIEAELVTWY